MTKEEILCRAAGVLGRMNDIEVVFQVWEELRIR